MPRPSGSPAAPIPSLGGPPPGSARTSTAAASCWALRAPWPGAMLLPASPSSSVLPGLRQPLSSVPPTSSAPASLMLCGVRLHRPAPAAHRPLSDGAAATRWRAYGPRHPPRIASNQRRSLCTPHIGHPRLGPGAKARLLARQVSRSRPGSECVRKRWMGSGRERAPTSRAATERDHRRDISILRILNHQRLILKLLFNIMHVITTPLPLEQRGRRRHPPPPPIPRLLHPPHVRACCALSSESDNPCAPHAPPTHASAPLRAQQWKPRCLTRRCSCRRQCARPRV